MAEKHVAYSVSSMPEILYRLLVFVRDSGQDAVRIVNDGTGTDAVFDGTGYVNAADITAAGDFGDGSFIVVEPVAAMPGGERWQARIFIDIIPQDVTIEVAATKNSYTNKWTNAGFFDPSQPVTGQYRWNDGGNPSAGAQLLVSSSDLETYDQEEFTANPENLVNYTYFRAVIYEAALSEGSKFLESFYAGGYKPCEPHNDLNPWCMFWGDPDLTDSTQNWGYDSIGVSMRGRAPNEASQITLDLDANGHTFAAADFRVVGNPATHLTESGQWYGEPIKVINADAGHIKGVWGNKTAYSGNINRSDGASDANSEYIVVFNAIWRWNPSA